MKRKVDFNELKKYINEHSNGLCELIYTGDITNGSTIELICRCGKHFSRVYRKPRLETLTYMCNDCYNKWLSEKNRSQKDDVIQYIEKTGCKYISGDYINNASKLLLQCKCGNYFTKDMRHFKRGQQQCIECANKKVRESKLKYTIDDVRRILATRGYSVLDDKYINCDTPLRCVCKRGHEVNIILTQFFNNCSGCQICAHLDNRGANHWNYRGGISDTRDYFRKHLKTWKKEVLSSYNNKCILTDSNNDLVVHHLISFNDILKDCCDELRVELCDSINSYDKTTLDKLEEKVLAKHNLQMGVPLQRKVHNKYHSLYGHQHNTKEEFFEFVNKYYPKKNILIEKIK